MYKRNEKKCADLTEQENTTNCKDGSPITVDPLCITVTNEIFVAEFRDLLSLQVFEFIARIYYLLK
jgi:hypothetical protein